MSRRHVAATNRFVCTDLYGFLCKRFSLDWDRFFFPIQILIFWMLRNNADAGRCSYFELGATCGIHCKFFHTDFFAFQIPRLFPRRSYCKSVKTIQSHRPGVKICSKCQQVPKVKARPSRDKCILKANLRSGDFFFFNRLIAGYLKA